MKDDKAIRAAKLTLGGILEKNRAKEAKQRAPGQIAPSKYMPNVPRAVHAGGGRENGDGVVVYQGRSNKGIQKFFNPNGHAWGSTDPGTAGLFAGQNETSYPNAKPRRMETSYRGEVHKLRFDIKNPMRVDIRETMWDAGKERAKIEEAKAKGHDGLEIYHHPEKSDFVAFSPDQVEHLGSSTPETTVDHYAVGGYVPAPMMMGAPRLAVAKAPRQAPQQEADVLASLSSLSDTAKSISGEDAPTAPEPHAARAEPHGYGEGISAAAAKAMANLQGAWTGQDFGIVSGYRDPDQNAAAKGAKDSQHLHGNAFDFNTTGWPEEEKLLLADAAWDAGFRGVGFYDNNMHFDVGDPRGWGPSFSRDSIPDWAQGWTQNRYGYAGGGGIGDNDNFANWFGNSVTHTDGEPHVFYTGTSKDKDFTSFNVGRHGAWFTRDPAVASSYAEQNDSQGYKRDGWDMVATNTASRVIPAYVKAENPYTGPLPPDVMRDNYKASQSDWFDTLRAKGHDAWIPADQGGNLVVALKEPHQIKSIYNNGKFDPNQKHMNKADGGSIGDAPDIQNPMSIFPKPQRMFPEDQRPPGGQYLSMPNKADVTGHKAETAHIGVGLDGKPFFRASQNAVDQTGSTGTGTANVKTNLFKQKAGWRWSQAPEGHENTQTIVSVEHRGKHYYALNAHFPKGVDLARYENATSEPRLRPTTRGNVDLGPQAGSITVRGREHPVYHHVIVKADGGAVERALGGRTVTDHGLYSRAAEIIRGLPQDKGTVDQYIAAAKKLGAKPSEIEHAGRPEGDKITREEMAKHFDRNLPKMEVHQYGENPSYLSREQEKRLYALGDKKWQSGRGGEPLSEAEEAEHALLMRRTKGPQVKYESNEYNEDNEPRPTEYQDYNLPGGSNYRERLLTLPETGGGNDYRSSHWSDNDNVLAHIRMSDRTMGGDRESMRPIGEKLAQRFGVSLRDLSSGSALTGVKEGLITPEEGATFSRFMRWNNGLHDKPGLDKRVLHVEEMQSDWGQEGRDKGFSDPKNPYEVFNTKTKKVLSRHPSYSSAWDAYRAIPEDQAADIDTGKSTGPSAAPYVTNTQHWTDLALKNILHEAAMGNYDHVVFTPGQAQADRYGLDKKLDRLQYMPQHQALHGFKGGASVVYKEGVKPEDLPGMVGKDLTDRLLHPDNTFTAGANQFHELKGDDLKMGGQGMKGYYDDILPKSVMRLAQQHDPDIKPGSMPLSDQYTGFSIPMTDKLKQGILGGQTAFKRGGTVDVEKALAVTRGFTKDGKAATMKLKLKE